LNLILTSKLGVATVPRNGAASAGDRWQSSVTRTRTKNGVGWSKAGILESQGGCDDSGGLYSTRGEEPRRDSYDANKGLYGGYNPVTRTAGSFHWEV